MTRLFVCIWLLLLFISVHAQDFSNKGKEFWIAYPAHIDATSSRMALYISSTENTTGEVQLDGKVIPFAVTANQATTVQISPIAYNIYNAQSDGIGIGKGIKVVSLKPVVVYAHILNAARSGSTLVFPTNVLGKEYISLNFTQSSTNNARSQITVVATEDNTVIELNLKAQSSSTPVRAANAPYQINLSKGDIYQVQATQDLTGSTIKSVSTSSTSCKPIAVFTGSTWTAFDCGSNNGGDNLYQQVFPSKAWGRNYITAPFANRLYDIYRIIVKDPSTIVNFNGTNLNPASLIANSYYEFKNNQANIISSDKPILVVQYMTTMSCDTRNLPNSVLYPGDPEIVTINPLEQTINNVSVVSARRDLTPPNTNITAHYLNVIMKTNNTSSLKIDGVAPISQWTNIAGSAYSYLQENVTGSTQSNVSHNIKADSGFIAVAYGMGNVESYGYNAGTNIVDLNPPLTIQNEFSASNVSYSATCSNTPFKINLSLTYQPTKIVVDFYSAANLIGTSLYSYDPTGPDSTYTSNGKIYYLYRVPQTYKFLSNGNYPVKITTTSAVAQSDGCSNNDQQEIKDNVIVNAPPTADFKIESNGCINNAIALTDLSDGIGRPVVRWLWEFSDGTTSAAQNPSKTFTTANNYTAKLTSITDFGCIAQEIKSISVSAKPITVFIVPALRCLNSNIVFTDSSTIASGTASNTIAHWRWNLDNGAGVIAATSNAVQSFNYTTWGNKNVYLVTESNTGCISDTFRIAGFKINPLPEVGFVIPEVCLDDAFAPFRDTSKIADGSAASFLRNWKFNDGVIPKVKAPIPATIDNEINPQPSYQDTGNYVVTLKITSNNGCVASLSSPFKVNGSVPNAQFTVLQNNPLCSNDSIRITNNSIVNFGDVTRIDIYWDSVGFPIKFVKDEAPYIGKVYSNLYPPFVLASTPQSADFKISLVAYSGQSDACRKSLPKVIAINNSPKASFSDIRDICYDASPRQINQGSFVSAMAATQTYSGKGIDATGLFNPTTLGVGNEQLKYLVQNSAGCKDSAFQPITVWPSPVANWNVQSTVCEKNDLAFTDLSIPNFSNIVLHNWIFGDGTIQTNTTANSFTKKYASAQNYTASLQVITDSGCKSTFNQQVIKVNPLPIVNFSLPSICLPDGRGKFNNQSSIADGSEALFSYQWNFNDSNDPSGSTLKEPTHKYSALGPYGTQLKITTKEGCVDSLTRSLTTIYPWPKAAFTATPNEICLGDLIQFNDLGNGISSNPVIWNWDLANGNSSTLQNPNKRFTDSGTFTIQYYFLNAQGCVSDTVSKQVVVHPYPKITLGPKINVLEGGSSPLKPQYKYGTNLSYLWTPSTYLNNDTDSIPITTPLADITYELRLTGIGGCSVADQIDIKVLLSPVVPNAFSPNGDGINDRWSILYLESYPGATVDVYDRYGQVVFSSVGYSVDWDGTVKGKNLPIGTYYYIINPKNGRKIVNGSVTIIR